jgi:hypothetical protein
MVTTDCFSTDTVQLHELCSNLELHTICVAIIVRLVVCCMLTITCCYD